MTVSFAEDLVGVVLDERYRLDALLGEGGMGAVFRAHHLPMDRKVAVKLLKPHLTADEAALQRFAREARSTMKVESEHAVKVLDFGITPHRDYYMVLEYLDGRTVQRELDIDGPFAPLRVIHIAKQVLHALGAAHDKGLVHRDIKPDNILLMRAGDDPDFAKVLDFGVAKLMDGAARSSKSALAITQAGMVFGTPEFMSPEQACGQSLDGRSDLYSLAGTMFAMLTGCGLFKAGSPIEWLTHHARTPPPHLTDGLPALAAFTELDAALQKCLAKRREHRPRDAAQMLALLAAVEASLGPAQPAPPAGPPRGQAARTVFSPSSFIASIDPNATLEPQAQQAAARALANLTGHTAATASVRPALAQTSVPGTTTGALTHVQASRRGLWLALGASAILAILVATAIVASRKRTRDGAPVAKKEDEWRSSASGSPADAGVTSPVPPEAAATTAPANARDAGERDTATTTAPASAPDAAVRDHAGPEVRTGTRQPPTHRPRPSPAVATHIAAAEAARKAGNPLRQFAQADAALRADPRNTRARFLAADALIASGDLERGCKYLRDLGRDPAARERARQAGCPSN